MSRVTDGSIRVPPKEISLSDASTTRYAANPAVSSSTATSWRLRTQVAPARRNLSAYPNPTSGTERQNVNSCSISRASRWSNHPYARALSKPSRAAAPVAVGGQVHGAERRPEALAAVFQAIMQDTAIQPAAAKLRDDVAAAEYAEPRMRETVHKPIGYGADRDHA